MMRVLFIQLPPPRFSFEEPPVNIPLAAGFLIRALEAAGSRNITVDILEPRIVDVLGDKGLARKIVERSPDVLALSLYVWNVRRSLFLASAVKRCLPETRVLVGGPEVTPDNAWIQSHPAVDAGVFGEGESRIASVLDRLSDGKTSLAAIPGTFFRTSDGVRIDTSAPRPWNPEGCPYPYLDGRIGPSADGTIFVETVRGCPFRCRYCYYHKAYSTVRNHGDEAVRAILDFSYSPDSAVRDIYLMDPSFNARRGFEKILKIMAGGRSKKDIAVHTELRADLLTGADVELLREAGLKSAEVGLQTIGARPLRAAGRASDPEKVARGVHLLKDAGIRVTTGIILGLPEDSPQGFQRTMEWLKSRGAYSEVHPFVLSILPGTDFRSNAADLGLVYDPRPPYYVVSTPSFPRDAFQSALLECETAFDMEMDHIPPPSLVDRGPQVVTDLSRSAYISKWILSYGPSSETEANPHQVAVQSTDPFTIWFRRFSTGKARHAMGSTIRALSESNPHTILHVVLESSPPLPGSFTDELIAAASDPGSYVNRAYSPLYGEGDVVSVNFWVILPWSDNEAEREGMRAPWGEEASIVWDVGDELPEDINNAEGFCLVSRSSDSAGGGCEDLFTKLERLIEDGGNDPLFRDPGLQKAWAARKRGGTGAARFDEGILITA
ncbi:MAG: radical SAM protein [Pseudomonadota bacterium]